MWIRLTPAGRAILRRLALAHRNELERSGPGTGARIEFRAAARQEEGGIVSNHKDNSENAGRLYDHARVIPISLLAIGIGIVSTCVAWALLRLIAIFHKCFLLRPSEHRAGFARRQINSAGSQCWFRWPADWSIGFMARYGSERIRGHGIPEALESILINGSKVQPRLAILKPISSAISIGSGGPFGAEGPIIMTAARSGPSSRSSFT